MRSKGLQTHAAPGPLPSGSVLPLGEGAFCVSPAHLAVQMASYLTHLELVALLSELMGTYAIAPFAKRGMLNRERPLTTPEEILAHLDALGSMPGVALVRRALSHACVRSASPRETKLSLRLGLKPALGGYGLRILSMNEPFEVNRINELLAPGTRKPDILLRAPSGRTGGTWAGVAFEYNGADHDDEIREPLDIRRANELLAIDFKDYTIDKALYRDQGYLDGIVKQVRKDLGLPPQRLTKAMALRRRQLREELYGELELIDGIHWGGRRREQEARIARSGGGEGAYDRVPLEAYGLL